MRRILIISALLLAVVFTATADRRRLMLARNVTAEAAVDSPDDIANLFAWYKGDALVTNTAGALAAADESVAWWGDSSGNGRHLRTNNVHNTTPVYKTAAQTGKSQGGIQFAGTTNQLKIGFTALPDTTIFVVWRNNSGGAYKFTVDSTNTSARQTMYKRNTDLFTIASVTEQTVAGAIVNPSWNKFCAVFNSAGDDSIYTNGVVASTTLVSGSQSLDGLTLGGAWNGTSSIGNGEYLGEVIIYNRLLNSTEIGQIFTYLARWD